ncbi:MAG: hypothetical protein VX529_10630, partial [Pseudomonadota bacterium]|nr:hypothetical protein [Pseudomonadota bacterium]
MKRLGLILLVLVVLVIGAAFILPAVIPASAYRDRVEAAAGDARNPPGPRAGDVSLPTQPRGPGGARGG